MPHGLHHVTLTVSDLDRAREFYQGALGWEVDQDFPGYKLRCRLPGTSCRLVLLPAAASTPGDRFDERRIGLDHLALHLTSLEEVAAVRARLLAAGWPVEEIHYDNGGNPMLTVRDPDNIQWEFYAQP